jgi:hypothetical protein
MTAIIERKNPRNKKNPRENSLQSPKTPFNPLPKH